LSGLATALLAFALACCGQSAGSADLTGKDAAGHGGHDGGAVDARGPFDAKPGLPNVGDIITLTAVNGLYISAANDGAVLIANKSTKSNDEILEIVDAGNGAIGLRCLANDLFVSALSAGAAPLAAARSELRGWESFTLVHSDGKIGLIASINGLYVSAQAGGQDPLLALGGEMGSNESFTVQVTTEDPPPPPPPSNDEGLNKPDNTVLRVACYNVMQSRI